MVNKTIPKDLKGKVAVVTGGSRGIGKGIADELIQRGAKVVIGDILEGNNVVEEYNRLAGFKVAAFIRTDVSTYDDNKALFQLAESEFGGVDIAILNAGITKNSNTFFSPMEDDLEESIFKVNIIGLIKGSKVALMHMAKRGGGSIVCTSSLAGLYTIPDVSAYNATKHAIVGYVRSCTHLPAICNVRVNAVCPSFVDNPVEMNTTGNIGNYTDAFLATITSYPLVQISDVVKGVFTFLSDESKNAETLMILPDGLRLNIPDKLPVSSCNSESSQKKYVENIIADNKKQLAAALDRYRLESL